MWRAEVRTQAWGGGGGGGGRGGIVMWGERPVWGGSSFPGNRGCGGGVSGVFLCPPPPPRRFPRPSWGGGGCGPTREPQQTPPGREEEPNPRGQPRGQKPMENMGGLRVAVPTTPALRNKREGYLLVARWSLSHPPPPPINWITSNDNLVDVCVLNLRKDISPQKTTD